MSLERVALLCVLDEAPEVVSSLFSASCRQDRANSEVLDGMAARDNA